MDVHQNHLRIIVPIQAARLRYLPPERLGPPVGFGAKKLGIRLRGCIEIHPEAGEEDREFLRRYGPDTRWLRFDFDVSDKTLQWYERDKQRRPEIDPFDQLIAKFVVDVIDGIAIKLAIRGAISV